MNLCTSPRTHPRGRPELKRHRLSCIVPLRSRHPANGEADTTIIDALAGAYVADMRRRLRRNEAEPPAYPFITMIGSMSNRDKNNPLRP